MTTESAGLLAQVSEGLAAAVERAAPSIVLVSARRRIPATGLAWSSDGLVVTADHVIESEEDVTVGLPDDREVSATLVGRDPSSDLAVLRVEGEALSPPDLTPEGETRVGHMALAVGRPSKGGVQASFGVVSAVGGPWRTRGGTQIDGFLRTDTTFFPGFSGGPLVDAQGRVAGINSSRFGRGQGLTIPAASVGRIVETLVQQGRIRRAYLGIGSQVVRLPAALAEKAGGHETALLVVSVDESSPAGLAGLLVGDLLTGIEGQPVRDTDDLQRALGPERVGASVTLDVLSGGEPVQRTATLAERS